MALSKAMLGKLNDQITSEFIASQTYLAMACMFEDRSLKALAGLFRKQTEEERGHALKILGYIQDALGQVKLQAIPEPPHTWPSVLAAIEGALKHELKVTVQIHAIAELADEEKDFATRKFIDWFVEEQVEEVNSMSQLRDWAKMAGDNLLPLECYVGMMLAKK